MHLLNAQPGGFIDDDASVITRLNQQPADVVILSAADTTLALLAGVCPSSDDASFPSVRLANLLHLRQPASIDLYIDEVLQHAKVIIIDHLGGESYWSYGTQQVVELCMRTRAQLVMFSGDHTEDVNLLRKSTAEQGQVRTLWQYLRAGGKANARGFFQYIAQQFFDLEVGILPPPRTLPSLAIYHPQQEWAQLSDWQAQWQTGNPCVLIVFYRAHMQSGNTAVFDQLCSALLAQGLNPLPVAVASLKDTVCLDALRQLCQQQGVGVILNTTAFSRSSTAQNPSNNTANTPQQTKAELAEQALAGDAVVLQLIVSGSSTESWQDSDQGLSVRDIAMHIAMPEVDGRVITRAVSFKELARHDTRTQTDVVCYQPHAERIAFVAELAQRWCRLRALPNADKRLALILANYPTKEGRLGNGVGLDTPASVIQILHDLQRQGYTVRDIPSDGDALMRTLKAGVTNSPEQWALRPAMQSLAMDDYVAFFNALPEANQRAVRERWGAPEADPMLRENRFMIAGVRLGHVFVGIQPARGYQIDHMASYHDPDLVPPHHYLAFYCWLRHHWRCDAVVHVGKHGNLEWLPGKSVALSGNCWPDAALGAMPHLYPFIVNDPGEGTQAKRRAQAVIIDHLMPPLTRAESYGALRDLERMVDEYYGALMLDPSRATVLRREILQHILDSHLHEDLGVELPKNAEEEQALLNRTDAYLCELKEAQIRDGLHIFGQSPAGRLRRDTLLALARHPVGDGAGANASLVRALAEDLDLPDDFNPLDSDWAQPWTAARPAVLQTVDEASAWRSYGDTRERLELLALQLLGADVQTHNLQNNVQKEKQAWAKTQAVLQRINSSIAPNLDACGTEELRLLSAGLSGQFVPAGPSGAPTRGRPDVLPTGRNFYSVDTRALPTQTSWRLGKVSAERLVERYMQEHGDYPRSIGLSVWGTSTMRTGGDDIAQAFALLGVQPKWADGSYRVVDFAILPLGVLGRPRIDVTLRVSGFFRDAFANLMHLFDAAVQGVAALEEESKEDNPIRARILKESAELQKQGMDAENARRQASYRVFGSKPGAYGAGLQGLIDNRNWDDDGDLARAYLNWGAYAYGQGAEGVPTRERFEQRLQSIEVVMHNQDNREHDVLDSDDYYQFQGGMVAAVRTLSGTQPAMYFGDHSNPHAPKVRPLAEEISRVVRSRVVNPKWIEGVKRHGYKGAFEMAATVDYLFAYDATTQVVRDDQYVSVADAFVEDADTRAFLQQHNPDALFEMCERLLEAMQRGLWQSPGDYQQRITQHLLDVEQILEAGGA